MTQFHRNNLCSTNKTPSTYPPSPFPARKGENASPRFGGTEGGHLMPAHNIVIGQKVTSAKVQRAKELRQNMTEAEKILWQAVRANRLNGWHFRRQQIIAGFIADFYCHAAALVIEVDGPIHENQQEYDQTRAEAINTYNIAIIRFKNEEIFTHLSKVLAEIDSICHDRLPFPKRERAGG